MTKFYVDTNGVYLGGFDNAIPPDGSIEIFSVPENGNDIWNGNIWVKNRHKQFVPLNPAQVRLVLHQFSLLDIVESTIKAGDKSLQIEWDYRTEFARDNALLLSMATALNISDLQLDEMFEAGILL